ncbi:hypothetical protein [Acetobacter vaccinii]|uniref:Uncharacterized protein n=1 Tax=Acetobacter vaccinii TaxID=2592655 RepID=A0A5C1YQP3_9PROT|nr:hypothetical protein [Acetobacter vaccinii]QEO18053.1 hypothetical protein FLP30_10180 [Acetobacter vaccinii]
MDKMTLPVIMGTNIPWGGQGQRTVRRSFSIRPTRKPVLAAAGPRVVECFGGSMDCTQGRKRQSGS